MESYKIGDILYIEKQDVKTIFRVKKISGKHLYVDWSISLEKGKIEWVKSKRLNIKNDVQKSKIDGTKEYNPLPGFEIADFVERYATLEEVELLFKIYS